MRCRGGLFAAFRSGFRAPAMVRWPGKMPPGSVENGIMSGLDCQK
jgi:arylsulfatase